MNTFRDVVIIGAGAYGAATALELSRLGHRVTVLERTSSSSAADSAASNDINKVIRADYDVRCLRLTRTCTTVTCARSALICGVHTPSTHGTTMRSVFFSARVPSCRRSHCGCPRVSRMPLPKLRASRKTM